MTARPVEWHVLHPLDAAHRIAIIRYVKIEHEPYYRAVTYHNDPSQRQLIGYYATLDDATNAAYIHYEKETGMAISGGGQPAPTREPIPWKASPEQLEMQRAIRGLRG